MELSSIPTVNGRRNFEEVKRLASITCTEREFGDIVGISRAYVHRLKDYGVIEVNAEYGRNARILLARSLRDYRKYLSPEKRSKLDERLAAGGYDVLIW